MTDERSTTSRRRFMKATGIGGLGLATGLAGCTGGGGDGGDGGSGGGGGDGGGGGGDGGGGQQTPTPTRSGELQQVNITLAPSGFQGIMMDHIVDNGILADEMEQRGYTANVQKTWEGAALFAAGGPDFSTISSFEAAILGAEREIDLAVVANIAPLFMGWWVDKGGDYDPAQVGSAQGVMDKIVEEEATTAIGAWSGGDVPGYTMAIDTVFGYTFGQDNNDFETVTADYFAIPKLIKQGRAAAGGTSPIHGVARHIDDDGNPTHTQLFNVAASLEAAGVGVPPLNSLTTTKQFADENRGAAEAYVRAWYRGMAWLFEDPMGRIMEDKEEHFQQLGVANRAQAQYLVDWGVNLSLDNQYPYNYKDIELTDQAIEEDQGFLKKAEQAGFIPENWESRVNYVKVAQE